MSLKSLFPLYRHISIQHTLFQFVLRMCEFQSGGRKGVWHLKWAHEESDNQWIQRLRIIHLSNWKRILFSETPGVFKRSNTIRSLGWVITDVVTFWKLIFAFVSIVGRREVTGNEGREKGCRATNARSHSRCGCCDHISVFKTPKPLWHSSVGGLLRHCLWFWAIQINLTWTDTAAAIAVSSLFDISAVPPCFTVVGRCSYLIIHETNSFCAGSKWTKKVNL